MSYIYNLVIYNPIFNLLVWFYNVIPGNDIGIAIIALTIIIKLLLLPLTKKSLHSQKALQDIQPKIKELQKKYKDEKEVMAKKLMELYKTEKVSPFSSCLPMIVQFPFLIAVYQVLRHGLLSEGFEKLYSFVANPGIINPVSFGIFDMSKPSIYLAVLAGIAQFVQSKMMINKKPATIDGKEIPGSKDEKTLAMTNKQMLYFMPLFTVFIGMSLPAGLSLYWFISTSFMAIHQFFLFRSHSEKSKAEVIVNNK